MREPKERHSGMIIENQMEPINADPMMQICSLKQFPWNPHVFRRCHEGLEGCLIKRALQSLFFVDGWACPMQKGCYESKRETKQTVREQP